MLNNIIVNINGQSTSYPVRSGTTAEELLDDDNFIDLFQVPENVSALINGSEAGGRALQAGDTLSFQTKASSKAA